MHGSNFSFNLSLTHNPTSNQGVQGLPFRRKKRRIFIFEREGETSRNSSSSVPRESDQRLFFLSFLKTTQGLWFYKQNPNLSYSPSWCVAKQKPTPILFN